jgi:hypothetical protein
MFLKDLPWNLSSSNLIATVSDADAFNRQTQSFLNFEKEVCFSSESCDVLQARTEASVSEPGRKDGLKIFQGGWTFAFLGDEGVEGVIGADPFDVNEMGEVLTQWAIEKVLNKTERDRTLGLFVIHPADVILV